MGLFGKKNPKILREIYHGTTRLRVIQNELWREKVGIIVNVTNQTLDHPEGDSKQIIITGSHQLVISCRNWVAQNGLVPVGDIAVTEAGKLKALYVIHISSPVFNTDLDNQEQVIKDLILKCLRKGEELRVNSISFPPFCLDHFGFPIEMVVPTMIDAVQEYLLTHTDNAYSEIRFVSQLKHVRHWFIDEFEKRWPDCIPVSKKELKKKVKKERLSATISGDIAKDIEKKYVRDKTPQRRKPEKKVIGITAGTEIELRETDFEEFKDAQKLGKSDVLINNNNNL
ncbi:unnamed protein product [Blepharisma stoltei]|uniref:Macro domain-containing protein n=1 Tax=Blepharisma stoltei TaxID=1481888 RepID=A0AAU9IVA8_9CILI|nr:unnamed protein product [Blepharisma stoltei]